MAYQGLVFLHRFVHGQGGAYIAHYAAHIQRKFAGGHFAPGDGLDQLFFRTLRIFFPKFLHLHAGIIRKQAFQTGDGFGFVLFYADIDLFQLKGFAQHKGSGEEFLRAFKQYAVVDGNIGLAFGRVYQQVFHFFPRRDGKFHVGGETGAAQSHNAFFFDFGDDFRRGEGHFPFQGFGPVDVLLPFVPLHIYINGGLFDAAYVCGHIHFAHGSGVG